MRLSRFAVPFLVLFLSVPLFAQNRAFELLGYATWVDLSGDQVFRGPTTVDDFRLNFNSDRGWGGGINVFWGNRISTEFAVAVVSPEATLTPGNTAIPPFIVGDLEMIPITVTLQWHFAPGARINPYIGAGAAYVLFDQVDRVGDITGIGVRQIDFDDDVGFLANAGVTFNLGRNFGINLDAKYVPVRTSATAVFVTGPGQAFDFDVNPLMLSAGIRLGF
jgi:outer membrane protein W